mmetsp:Transcript_24513/g.36058  ORF Transcript_24513/g.36058 Transcript_24513/m.36058 type:complete len:389 (+) Transcript_24513:61-1227(+)
MSSNHFTNSMKWFKHISRTDPAFLFLNIGTATGLAGFCMSDPLALRSCSIIGTIASITFVLTRNPIHSYVPVYWSTCFIAVNVYKITGLLLDRKPTELNEDEEEVYVRHFMHCGMRPGQFKRLVKAARRKEFKPGDVIEKEVTFPSTTSVKLLMEGKAIVYRNNNELFTIDANKPICFLGDLSLLRKADEAKGVNTQKLIPSFVSSATAGSERVVVLEWDQEFLLKVLTEKSEIADKLRTVLTNSVMQKLLDISSSGAKSKYFALLSAFSVDGEINSLEKEVLQDYISAHNIDEETHNEALALIGWSPNDFERGYKIDASSVRHHSIRTWDSLKAKIFNFIDNKHHQDFDEIVDSREKKHIVEKGVSIPHVELSLSNSSRGNDSAPDN